MKLISAFMLAVFLASTPALAQRHGGGYAGIVRGGPVYGVRIHIPVGHAVWPGYRTVYPYRYPYHYPFSYYYGRPYAYYGYPYPYYYGGYAYPYYSGYVYPYVAYPYVYVH